MLACFSTRRHWIATFALWIATDSWLTGKPLAQPPPRLANYRFITDMSTVAVTGGIVGIDWPLNIMSRFGHFTGLKEEFGGPTSIVPRLAPYAAFNGDRAI
jgi:hypothetical protein